MVPQMQILLLLFSFLFHTLQVHALQAEQVSSLLEKMSREVPGILQNMPEVRGQFLYVTSLDGAGPSFINSVYLIKTTEEELVIKIANPLWKEVKTTNEAAALAFLKANTKVPVPEVLAFETDEKKSPLGCENIIMPKIKGKPLSSEISRLYQDRERYLRVLDKLAAIVAEIRSYSFSELGNFTKDGEIHGIVDFAGYEVDEPCKCYSEYAKHALRYYIAEMQKQIVKNSPEADLYRHYTSLLNSLLSTGNFNSLDDKGDRFVFSHQDFVMKNILVDGDEVTAVLDWEWSGSALSEIESMTGFDFLLNDADRDYFITKLEQFGCKNFFQPPPPSRQLFYRLLGNVYSLVAFREWREGKLEHTAKFLVQKLEQRKIRNSKEFDVAQFVSEVALDLDECLTQFAQASQSVCEPVLKDL